MNTIKVVVLSIFILIPNSLFSQNWYIEGYTEEDAKNYFSYRDIDPIEGIWQSSDGYRYAIEKDVERDVELIINTELL